MWIIAVDDYELGLLERIVSEVERFTANCEVAGTLVGVSSLASTLQLSQPRLSLIVERARRADTKEDVIASALEAMDTEHKMRETIERVLCPPT